MSKDNQKFESRAFDLAKAKASKELSRIKVSSSGSSRSSRQSRPSSVNVRLKKG